MKKHPDVKQSATNVSMNISLPGYRHVNTNFFYTRIKAFMPKWDIYLNVNGDHIKVQCVTSATHAYVPYILESNPH
jgi:hypothetical protein